MNTVHSPIVTAREEPSVGEAELKEACLHTARQLGIDGGPWLEVASTEKGWSWLRRALDEPAELAPGSEATIGLRQSNGTWCGEYNPDGDADGYAFRILTDGGWACGEWRSGRQHGKGVRVYPNGARYEGQWLNGLFDGKGLFTRANEGSYEGCWLQGKYHGSGVMTTLQGRHRICGLWVNGKQHGKAIITTCACFDAAPDLSQQLVHHEHSPSMCRPYGLISYVEYEEGLMHGNDMSIYCNGDIYERSYHRGHDTGVIRFVMNPDCSEDRFRGYVIEGVEWKHPTITRADGSLAYCLSHPDPATAPDAFSVYRDYHECGFLPVEDRDRDEKSELLAEAAERLPPSQ